VPDEGDTAEVAVCSECGRLSDDPEQDGWRDYSDGGGELLPFCAECSRREFPSPRSDGTGY
jgi:hypothetical protein